MKWLIRFLLFLSFLLFCENPNDSESVIDNFSATIYIQDGKTPSSGTIIRLYDINPQKNNPAFTVITGLHGDFSVADIPSGIYRLFASRDTLVLFQDSLIITPVSTTLHDDTLESPSSITGIIGMNQYHDYRSVTVQIAGFDMKPVIPDTSGVFTIAGLSSGTWPLQICSSIPGYLPTTVTINVLPCSHTKIPDTLFIMQNTIPSITELKFKQDTLSGTLLISWKKPEFKPVQDYYIYRYYSKSMTYSGDPVLIVTDTFCIDSVFSLRNADPADTMPSFLGYRIAIRDLNNEIGPASSLFEFKFAPKELVTTNFTYHITYPQFTGDSDSTDISDTATFLLLSDNASIGDTVVISFSAHNRTRLLQQFFLFDTISNDTVLSGKFNKSVSEFADTLYFTKDSAGEYPLRIGVVDNSGILWTTTTSVQFVKDVPIAKAGVDRSVLITDSVHLHGDATQNFGTIISWKWKIGFGPWTSTASSDTTFAAKTFREAIICSLAVMDDDSNLAYDAVTINIITSMNIKEFASGGFHNLFLNNKGVLFGSGLSSSGQLGANDPLSDLTTLSMIATNVQGMTGGDCHTLFVQNDGIARACGWNYYGQLGNGTTRTQGEPVQILSDVHYVIAGANHSLFLKNDSTLWGCGNNRSGQLGDSTLLQSDTTIQIATNVQYAAAGSNHTMIIKSDGTLWVCGQNDMGQLGDSTTTNRSTLKQIMTNVKSVSAGRSHSLIIKTDGSLWTCGLNSAGQLGDNTLVNKLIPVKIMENVQQVAAGYNHSLILTTDGSLWVCGDNSMGQLGDGTTLNLSLPTKVADNVKKISAGGWHSMMMRKDGTVWIWGWNNYNVYPDLNELFVNSVPVLYIP